MMRIEIKEKLKRATRVFYDELPGLENFPQAWLDGFANVIVCGQTDSDDDNPFEPDFEQPNFINYQAGARAAQSLLNAQKER
jgi:hypothetical protein